MTLPRYMNVPDVAAYLRRSENAIRHLVKAAAIPHIKIGRRVLFDRLERPGIRALVHACQHRDRERAADAPPQLG